MSHKITLTITEKNGQIIITPPSGVELTLSMGEVFDLTITEAAEKYKISRNTLAKAVDNGTIPSDARGVSRFVRPENVEAWLKAPRKRGRPKRERMPSSI